VEVVKVQRERAKTLAAMAQNSMFFFREPSGYDAKAAAKHLTQDVALAFQALRGRLERLPDWNPAAIHDTVVETAQAHGFEFGRLAQPLPVALTGRAVSPPIDVTLHLVGRDRSLRGWTPGWNICAAVPASSLLRGRGRHGLERAHGGAAPCARRTGEIELGNGPLRWRWSNLRWA
jgi:hypothetical protein